MPRREIFAGVTSAAPPARFVIRLTYAGDQPCHGLDVASRTWPIFFGCSSTGPGLPGSFVDDASLSQRSKNLQISANPGQARHFGSWYPRGHLAGSRRGARHAVERRFLTLYWRGGIARNVSAFGDLMYPRATGPSQVTPSSHSVAVIRSPRGRGQAARKV
jgi:hypothetical protein